MPGVRCRAPACAPAAVGRPAEQPRTEIKPDIEQDFQRGALHIIETLQSMPEPLRSQMLDGDFSAGMEDDEWQAVYALCEAASETERLRVEEIQAEYS